MSFIIKIQMNKVDLIEQANAIGMATPVGLEPTTYRLEVCCSVQLSYGVLMVLEEGLEPPTC